jgi:hypothetical protein
VVFGFLVALWSVVTAVSVNAWAMPQGPDQQSAQLVRASHIIFVGRVVKHMSQLCRRLAWVLCAFLFVGTFPAQLAAQQHCGKERWSVKTGTDPDAGSVNLTNPQTSTIAQLITLSPPNPLPPNNRFGPTENSVFVVTATLTDYKLEGGAHGDSDYHLVLQDDQGNTMVAEIPFPGCVGDGSPFATQIANARAAFNAQFTATTSFQVANVPVQVTGVGFFDFAHGQRGAAPNVIELHPVLDIVFNPSPQGSDFSLSLPSPINLIQGGSTTATMNVTTVAGGTTPTLTVSGLPTGVTSKITPSSSGKSTVSLTASSAAPAGSFPLTVTGTAGGKSHSQTVQVNVSPFASPAGSQQWEYQVVSANSETDVVDQANALGAQEWEMVGIVKVQGTPAWRAFFRRLKNNF